MMIFLGVVMVLGLRTRQPRRYWYHAACALAIQLTVAVLFAGAGATEGMTEVGLIPAILRQGTNAAPLGGVAGLVSLAFGWGVPIWLVNRGFVRKGGMPLEEPESVGR